MKDIGGEEYLDGADLVALVRDVFQRAGLPATSAGIIADTVYATECRGLRRLGLGLVPQMIEHLRAGRVTAAVPLPPVETAPAALCVDAAGGFACPGMANPLPALIDRANALGIATLALHNAYPLATPWPVLDQLADAGLSAIATTAGLSPRLNPNGTLRLEIEQQTHGLGPASPDLPGGLDAERGKTFPPFEGPLGAPFRLSHRLIVLQSDHDLPGLAPLRPGPTDKPGIAVPASLLEKIITA